MGSPLHVNRIIRLLFVLFYLLQFPSPQTALGSGVHPRPDLRVSHEDTSRKGSAIPGDRNASIPTQLVVAKIYFTGQPELNSLAQTLDIWEVRHSQGFILARVSPSEWESLANIGYRLEIDALKTRLLNTPLENRPGQTSGIPGFPCYRTVEETYLDIQNLATASPGLAKIFDIGDSWDKIQPGGPAGYDLLALRLTNEAIPGPKPTFFLMAEIHAREFATAELALRFGEWLIQNYGSDPEATWLLDYYEVQIVAMTNPDGRKMAESNDLWWRKNTDNDDGCFTNYGVDLNRNHDFQWGTTGASRDACSDIYRGPGPASEPETQAIQNYVAGLFPDQRGPSIFDPAPQDATGVFLTLHSYSPLVLFPWGWSDQPSPNDKALETLGRKFGYYNHYEVCQSGEPGCIYPTSGSSDDWAYGELGIAAYTFEVGTSFFETCEDFTSTVFPDNLPALLYAFKAARQPYLDPAGPETLQVSVTPATASPGETITITASADDTRYYNSLNWGVEPTQPLAAARYSIDLPSWMPGARLFVLPAGDGTFDAPVENLSTTVSLACLPPGQHTLFVESQDSAGDWGIPGSAFIQVEPGSAIDAESPAYSQHIQPGQTITYTLQITNLGNITDTFGIQLLSPWRTAAPTTTPLIAACSPAVLQIAVTSPGDALPGESSVATLILTSQVNPSIITEIKLYTSVPKTSFFLPFIFQR